jgi:hypothetical protein
MIMVDVMQVAELEPIKVRIERGQRGNVGWEISVHGDNADRILEQIRDIDRKLSAEYGKPGATKEKEEVY